MASRKKGGLGKGLDALFATEQPIFDTEDREQNNNVDIDDADRILYIDINDIKPNPDQPRKTFDQSKLEELARSIKENGVIQPLVVRKADNGYELVAGERRWRASRIAGLKKVPCIVRDFDERQNMIAAILENMQREDLDPMEEAAGLREMINKFDFTQEQMSNVLGKSRAYIANSLRLLKLPEKMQNYIREGKMSAAHGRTLITIEDGQKQDEICERVVNEGLSVRETEKLADKAKKSSRHRKVSKKKEKQEKSADILAVEDDLRKILGTKVNINGSSTSGKIEIDYYSTEDLNRIIDLIREE